MEKQLSAQYRISQKKLINSINLYATMRNITVPMEIIPTKIGLKLIFIFKNIPLDFTVTNIEDSYIETVLFIEEMNDNYITSPIGHFTYD